MEKNPFTPRPRNEGATSIITQVRGQQKEIGISVALSNPKSNLFMRHCTIPGGELVPKKIKSLYTALHIQIKPSQGEAKQESPRNALLPMGNQAS
jgi:hypothetical protein